MDCTNSLQSTKLPHFPPRGKLVFLVRRREHSNCMQHLFFVIPSLSRGKGILAWCVYAGRQPCIIIFPLTRLNTNFPILFWAGKQIQTNFLFQIFSLKLIFKVPKIFWKWKLCRACTARALVQIRRCFGIGLIKIYLIVSIVPVFENRKNYYIISLHPNVQLSSHLFLLSVSYKCIPK